MSRWRASASATRDVSIVIHRRPHCSATYAVVPEPQVGSSNKVTGIGAHQHAALYDLGIGLDDIELVGHK